MFHFLLESILPEFDHSFQVFNNNVNLKGLGSGTNSSAVCISICLTSLALCTFNNWEKNFLHLFKMLWESASRSQFFSFTKLLLGCYPFLNSFNPLYRSLMLCNMKISLEDILQLLPRKCCIHFMKQENKFLPNDSLSSHRPVFSRKSVHVVFVVGELELGQIFLQVIWYSSTNYLSTSARDSYIIVPKVSHRPNTDDITNLFCRCGVTFDLALCAPQSMELCVI
jgi:hypothetical protein